MTTVLLYNPFTTTSANFVKGLVEIGSDGTATKLTDFNNLKSELAKVTPSGVQSNSYTPTNTAARSCPTADSNWSASTVLPPTPNRGLCSCMVSALSCVAATKVQEKDTGDLFNYICGESKTDCSGITANGTTGEYGAYSMCSPLERVSWAMNAVRVLPFAVAPRSLLIRE